jgi:beta-ribofuranosylaminobenzene 5'-phosphate synthase
MVDKPGLRISIAPATEFSATGPLSSRANAFARRWAEFHRQPLPACAFSIESAPPEHAGLGTGTQLGLSVAAGLSAWCGLPNQTPRELALSVGRGQRSAVGTYGFVLGGLIVEQGKLPTEPISLLDCRVDLPADWRFVLVRQAGLAGLAGESENDAIAALPAIPAATTDALIAEVRERLVPAAATGDFAAFAASLYCYGHAAGLCFAARQGGAYNGPVLTAQVERIRGLGYPGVGQSSWGPTLYAAVPSQAEAERLLQLLSPAAGGDALDVTIAAPANAGAVIAVAS